MALLGMTENKKAGMTCCVRRQRIKNKKGVYKSINGAYAKVFCHVEQAKCCRNISRKRCPRCVMLSKRSAVETSRGSVAPVVSC